MKLKYFIVFFAIACIGASQSSSALTKNELSLEHKMANRAISDGFQNMRIINNTLFLASKWGIVFAYDISNQHQPKQKFIISTKNGINAFDITNSHVYIADQLGNLLVFSYTSSSASLMSTKKISSAVTWVKINNGKLFLTLQKNGIESYSLANPVNPKKINAAGSTNWAWFVQTNDANVFVVDKRKSINIYDNSLKLSSSIPNKSGQNQSVLIDKNHLFVAAGSEGVKVFDIANPSSPTLLKQIPVPNAKKASYVYSVYKFKNFLYASDNLGFLYIFNVQTINKPVLDDIIKIDNKSFELIGIDKTVYLAADKVLYIYEHNHAPEIKDIGQQTVREQQSLNITLDIKDKDNHSYKTFAANLPKGMKYNSKNKSFSWTPNYRQSGIYENVKVVVIENTADKLQDSLLFNIEVKHVNRLPNIPKVKDVTVRENEKISFKIPKASDDDAEDKGKLRYYFLKLPKGASFFERTLAFNWTPDYEQAGVYELTYGVQDVAEQRHEQKVKIRVIHVDRKPVMKVIKDQKVKENEELVFKINSSDPDKEDKNKIVVSAKKMPKGASFNASKQEFRWKPNFAQSGEFKVSFTIRSGKQTASRTAKIKVTNINRAPKLESPKLINSNENKIISFKIKPSDPDPEDFGKLTLKASRLPKGAKFDPKKNTFTWKPNFEQSGEYKVKFEVKDPYKLKANSETKIIVAHVNRAPVIEKIKNNYTIKENEALQFKIKMSDVDREDKGKLKIQTSNLPKGAVFDKRMMTLRWVPNNEQSGHYKNVTFITSDGKLTSTTKTNIIVTHVNRKPKIDFIREHQIKENESLTIKINVSDPDKEDTGKLKLFLENAPEGAILDQRKKEFRWNSNYNSAGVYDKIKLIVRDPNGLEASNFTKINVDNVNRKPSLSKIQNQTVFENETLKMELKGTDPDKKDQGKLVYENSVLPEGAFVRGNILEWKPNFEQAGSYQVRINAKDIAGASATRVFQIIVKNKNRKPAFKSMKDHKIKEGEEFSYRFDLYDPDKEDKGKLNVSASNLPNEASIINAVFKWKPSFEQAGDYELNLTLNDAGNLKDNRKMKIIVENVNRKPMIESIDNLTVKVGEEKKITLNAKDDDKEDKKNLKFHVEGFDALGIDKNILSFKADSLHIGVHKIKVHVSDGKSTDETTFELTINNVE